MIWATRSHGLGLAGTDECPCHWAIFGATPSTIPQESQHLAFFVVVISLFFFFSGSWGKECRLLVCEKWLMENGCANLWYDIGAVG